MTCFNVQILEPSGKIFEIENCIGNQISSIVLENRSIPNIQFEQCIAQLPSDFNDRIFSVIDEDIIASTGVTILSSGNKIYLNSIINANNGIFISHTSGIYTISSTGLQPSGNYSLVGHQHIVSDVNGLQTALDNKQPSGIYASGIHYHIVNDITDFNSGVSGLLPSISGNGYVVNTFSNNIYTISVSGLQPSGNYSLAGHSHVIDDVTGLQLALDSKQPSGLYASGIHFHTAGDITNFNSAVSGLIPPSNFTSLTGISGVVVTNTGTNYYVSLSDPTIQLADITDLSSNARTFLLTPSSNNLQTLIIDETGSGSIVFNNSPSLSGVPTAPTAPSGTNNTQIANTAFVHTEISNLINSAPSTLDTLNELAAALGNDPNFATTVINSLASKAALSGAIFTGSVTIPSGTGNFNNLTVNNSGVSLVGHTHISSNITDFNSSVSGLIPVKHIVSGTDINVTSVSGIYTINSTVNTVSESSSLVTTVFNKTGSPIPKMSAVYISGGQGDMPTISLAIATGDSTSAGTYGVTFENIPNMSAGKVIVFGALTGLDTDQFNPTAPTGNVNGQVLYLSPSVSGSLTLTKPSAPNHIVAIGTVVRTHQNEGVIEVRVQNGFELEELHNVAISGVTNGQFLQYNSSSQLWVPSSSGNFNTLSINGTGVSVNGHTHISSNITDFSSSVNSLVSGVYAPLSGALNQFSNTSSSQLASIITDETGTGVLVFNNSPNFSGIPTVPTASSGTNTNQIASTSFVRTEISNLVGSAPSTLDTLNELAAALGNDANFSTTITNSLAGKANLNGASFTGPISGPSGNFVILKQNGTDVSVNGHNHTSSNITDFASSVSGLLPVTNITGGSNITVSKSGTIYTVAVTGSLGLTTEEVDDRVANLLVAGSGIILSYNDNANTLQVSANINVVNGSNLYLWSSFR